METDNKRISISNTNVIKDIEVAFMLLYPYLKIEFFKIEAAIYCIHPVIAALMPNCFLKRIKIRKMFINPNH